MLVNIDCKSLSLKIVGGIIEVDCLIKKKKCLDCNRYKSLIKEWQLAELKGLLKPMSKKKIKNYWLEMRNELKTKTKTKKRFTP